jgi:hypothetical protein
MLQKYCSSMFKVRFELTIQQALRIAILKNVHGSFTLPSQWEGDKGMPDCFTGPSLSTVQLRGWARVTSMLQLQVSCCKKKFLYITIRSPTFEENKS